MPVLVQNTGTVVAVIGYRYQDSRITYTLATGGNWRGQRRQSRLERHHPREQPAGSQSHPSRPDRRMPEYPVCRKETWLVRT